MESQQRSTFLKAHNGSEGPAFSVNSAVFWRVNRFPWKASMFSSMRRLFRAFSSTPACFFATCACVAYAFVALGTPTSWSISLPTHQETGSSFTAGATPCPSLPCTLSSDSGVSDEALGAGVSIAGASGSTCVVSISTGARNTGCKRCTSAT